MAEANGNRTHLSQQSCDTQVLKTRRVTRPYAPPAADYSTSHPPTGLLRHRRDAYVHWESVANFGVTGVCFRRPPFRWTYGSDSACLQ